MSTNNGGAAFPRSDTDGGDGGLAQDGMSLRDWFAGQALMGLAAMSTVASLEGKQLRVKAAWDLADEMLKARGGK